jgi:hypothetical protein
MDRISDDLLALILGFVPAETCIVARAVSKRWLSVIDAAPYLLRGLSRPRIVAEFYARCKYRPAEAPRFALRFGITAGEARAGGNLALQIACESGYLDLARWLVPTFGLTKADVQFCRALELACEHNRLHIVKWLIGTFGADLAEGAGRFAFDLACWKGNLDVVRYLVPALAVPRDHLIRAFGQVSDSRTRQFLAAAAGMTPAFWQQLPFC